MRLGLFPLINESSYQNNKFSSFGIGYFNMLPLTGLIAYLEKQFPNILTFMATSLPQLLSRRPDVVILWANSATFTEAAQVAEVIKQNLDIPIILGGPHISHLPQSLPEYIDIGLLGEPELTLTQLLPVFVKEKHPSHVKYSRIPGLIYQNRGRIYSGSPAKVITNLDQLPLPKLELFHHTPGFSAPMISTSRGTTSYFSLFTQVPSPKVRFHSPAYIIKMLQNISENYRRLYRPFEQFPLPAVLKSTLSMVFVLDELFVSNTRRLQEICRLIQAHGFNQQLSFIVNAQPQALTPQVCEMLKAINTTKIMLQLSSFSNKSSPWFKPYTPEHLLNILKTCRQLGIEVIASYYLNSHYTTTMSEIIKTYWFLSENYLLLEQLNPLYVPPLPGTELWPLYVEQQHLQAEDYLTKVPWHSMTADRFRSDSPFVSKTLSKARFLEAFEGVVKLASNPSKFLSQTQKSASKPQYDQSTQHMGLVTDSLSQVYAKNVTYLKKRHLKPGQRILDIATEPEFTLERYLTDSKYEVQSIVLKQGKLDFNQLSNTYDMIIIRAFECCREPQKILEGIQPFLSPQGQLYLQCMNIQNIAFLLTLLNWPAFQSFYGYPLLHYFSEQTLKDLLDKTGYVIEDSDYIIMKNIKNFRTIVDKFLAGVRAYRPVPVHKEQLYVMEMMILAKNRK